MKFHNNDHDSLIITSNDVLVNGKNTNVLTDIINDQDEKLNELEKNVKWLYKYGGTGSKGGGNYNQTEFSVNVNILFGNTIIKKLDDQKIILSNSNKKYETLSISLSKANILNIYNVRISHGGWIKDPSTGSQWWSLNQDNDYSITLNIPLDESGTIKIEFRATSTLTGEVDNPTYIFTYISDPYVINLSLIGNDDKNILNNENLYVNDAISNGVNFYVDYNIISSKQMSYEILCDDNMLSNYEGIINDAEHGIGLGNLKIPFNSEFITDDINYGFHTITFKLKVEPDESLGILTGQIISKDLSFTYIPNDQIFFKLEPVNTDAKIYKYNINSYNNAVEKLNLYKRYYKYYSDLDNEITLDNTVRQQLVNELVDASMQSSITDLQLKEILNNKLYEIESELYIFNVGSLQLYIQAYFGSNVLNTVDVSYIASTDIDDNTGHELLSSLQYRKRQLINIPIQDEGIYRLCIYSNNQNPNKRIFYYFAVFDKNSGINWFSSDVKFNKIDLYYKEGKIGSNNINNTINIDSYIGQYKDTQKIQKYANSEPSYLFDINSLTSDASLLSEPNCDIMLSFGIQYSYINNENNKIMSVMTNNASSSLNFDIYQNKIKELDSPNDLANIFIPKEHNYAPANSNNYHLLTIYKRYIYETNAPYYEIIIYLDGCPEAAFKNFVKDASGWSSVILNNANFSINFFEIAYFEHNKNSKNRFDKNETSNTIISNGITYLDDVAISEYYYKYISSRKNLNSIISLLGNLRNFKETEYGMIEVASKNDIDSIASTIDIPVLLFEFTEQTDNEFINWFTKSYKESELTKDKKRLDNLYYSGGSFKTTNISLPSELSDSYWYIALQGSSTGELFSKNLTLGIENKDAGYMGIFTPNFYDIENTKFANYDNLSSDEKETVIKAKNSFLPETAFTLKADVVDSSHSNNTAVGAFVNANTTQFDILFDGGATNKDSNKYVNYIKNCLLGFPVLVFINVNKSGKSSFYFLGIYNFNLGRDSYFNMGYYSPAVLTQPQITSALESGDGNTFTVTYVTLSNEDNSSLPVDNGVIVAEIQGGKEYFDFSQYHSSILLPQILTQGEDNGCMFGDFVPKYNPAKSTDEDLRIRYHIPRLVEAIAKAGGYLFDNVLHKHLGEYKYRYNKYIDRGAGSSIFESANQVPNYTLQYIRSPQEGDEELSYLIHNFKYENGHIKLQNNQPIIDESYYADNLAVGRLIDKNVNDEHDPYQRGTNPILDYTSLTEYYVACMGFGLVDSVMKNLNVKSWNATYTGNSNVDYKTGKWFVAFYDMDTSFGRDNGGAKTSYFAFSDYWKTSKSSDLEQPTIYRDFYPMSDPDNPYVEGQSLDESGFDIPSSYLFAVAKYAHLLNTDESLLVRKNDIPHNIWARWRYTSTTPNADISGRGTGELRSADYFIKKYFIRNLDHIPEQLWALNYRFKYLKRITTDSTGKYNYVYNVSENGSFENLNYTPFHGKGINELYEWLGGRLHILDSYFNLEGNNKLNIKYLEYNENDNQDKFIPIIRLDNIVGYKYQDNEEPSTDTTGTYKWLATNYYEYTPDAKSDTLGENKDIEILKDIFSTSGNGARYSQPIDLYIKAQAFSPFNIQTAMGENFKYLLEDANKEYHITYKPSGLVITKFGGSTLWTYIKNLNTIINENALTLNTEALDQIVLTKGKCYTYNISQMKSLKTVSIIKDLYDNESKFTGSLEFSLTADNEDPYPDLTTIELVRTEITLNVNEEGVININLTGTQSGTTNITNCKNLKEVILTGFGAPSLTITPGWSNNMSINNTKINEIKLSPKNNNASERRISISNDSTVTSVILSDFTHISLINCPNLYNICIINPELVESLEIINCNRNSKEIHNLNIYYEESHEIINGSKYIPENETNIINLQRLTNIKSFKFNGTLGFNIIDVSSSVGETININGTDYNCIRLYTNAFSNTALTQIKTAPNVYLYIDTDNANGTTETFSNSSYGIYPNKFIIGKNVKKLNSLFSHDISGVSYSNASISGGFAADFLNCNSNVVIFENIDNITSLAYIFYGQSQISIDISNNIRPISLHNFKNVNDISYMLFATSVFTFSHEAFGTESEYCGMNVINNDGVFNLNCFLPNSCYVDIHIFDYYINNVNNLISDNSNISYRLNFYGYNENDIINITDIFSKLNYDNNKLESFLGFNIDDSLAVNWDSLLYDYDNNKIKFPKLISVINSISNYNKFSINYNNIGLNRINISLLELSNSFNFSTESKEKIIINEVINFNNLKENNPILPWNEQVNSLNGAKQIDETDIIPILNILNQKKCISLNNLFAYTNIIVNNSKENKYELILSDETDYNFISCVSLFDNAKFVDATLTDLNGNPIIYGFEITQNSLKGFKKVINWSKAFFKTTLHKNLPLNMFNLKNSFGDYIIDNYSSTITNLSSMFEYVKLDSNESWFNYNWTSEDIVKYNSGIELNGSYHNNIKTLEGTILTNPKSIDVHIENFTNVYGSNIIHNLILPWDIFYGCAGSCNISSFIANSDFEGILPSKLFPKNTRINNLVINDVFKNTLVVPNYVNDIVIEYEWENTTFFVKAPAYVFIPENFTNATYLINGFTFKMLLPNSESLNTAPKNFNNYTIENNGSIELYFVMQDNSINFANLESIKNFLPIDNITYYYAPDNPWVPKEISLHHIDDSITENNILIQNGIDTSFNARKDYRIHYYMYLNKELLETDNPEYPWITTEIEKLIDDTYQTVTTFKGFSRTDTDTGLPLANNTKLLYESVFNNDIISFAYGPIITNSLNLGSIQPISGSSPFININEIWSNFSHNIILPRNEINGATCYENVFNASTYIKELSLSNIYRNSQQSLDNYINSNKFIIAN